VALFFQDSGLNLGSTFLGDFFVRLTHVAFPTRKGTKRCTAKYRIVSGKHSCIRPRRISHGATTAHARTASFEPRSYAYPVTT